MTALERWLFWTGGAGTVGTGLVYLWMKYLMVGSDPYSTVHHPWQPLVLKLHIVIAPVLVFALGVVAVRHVWAQLALPVAVARRSGLTVALVAGPMIMTGYLIQVLTDERWLRAVAWGHIGLGTLFALGFLLHRWAARGEETVRGGKGR